MDIFEHAAWPWVGFAVFIIVMLCIDLGLFNRKAHTPSYKEAAFWSGIWVTLAMLFAGLMFWQRGTKTGLEFLTGYLIELSLSVDNLFVFLLIFGYFQVPKKYQHRVLFWGVLGALLMRLTMIGVGAALVQRFHWIMYIFGAFLVYTGINMLRHQDAVAKPEENPLVRLATRFIPITDEYEGSHFFTVVNGKRTGTLLLLVLIIVEVTDLVFAVDSIPAIFAVTKDTFILYTSNVFAILGLRSLFFLLAGVVEKFHYLKVGLAVVLSFIGAKMLLVAVHIDIPIGISLAIVAVLLLASIVASLIWPKQSAKKSEDDSL